MSITVNSAMFVAPQSGSQLFKVQEESKSSFAALSSGIKINQASDNPGLMGMISRLTSEVRNINVARQNVNQGVSLSQVAQTGVSIVSDDVQRLRELAVQAANGTLSDADRSNLHQEAAQLQQNIADTIRDTQFNGQSLLDRNSSISIQSGSGAGDQTDLQLRDLSGLNSTGTIDLSSQAGAEAALAQLDADLQELSDFNSSLGSYQNRLEAAADTISQAAINTEAARAQVRDTDIAAEMARQTGSAIRMQSVIAVQAQATQISEHIVARLMG
ncbi:flagellin domain protein [Magnetococcus marinus MC-1]|uniref:Flagellin n=1 Tax=Magnetococcus marinus (strain ATCC BAA-1437 / JCM 17883 / MC-1) TaxID=156889 RepID=A0LCM2_MAGMM|nr:flagellin [Magnetococcus marinus]ABK45715.1 flagellin domain protein [Magnetococcus marinus MC-1]